MTVKQRLVAKKLLENPGMPLRHAMLEAGYSDRTSRNPKQNLTKFNNWQELIERYLPDEKLLQVHKDGLDAQKVISAVIVGKDADSRTNDFIEVPDHPTRAKFLELGYKVKHKVDQPQLNIQAEGDMNLEFILDTAHESTST